MVGAGAGERGGVLAARLADQDVDVFAPQALASVRTLGGDETAHAIAPPGALASRRARDETAAAGVGEEERHRAGVVEVAVERATTRRGDVLVRRAECLGAPRARVDPGGGPRLMALTRIGNDDEPRAET